MVLVFSPAARHPMLIIVIRLLSVFLMVAAGAVARRRRMLDGESTGRLVALVTHIFYPALIYGSLVRKYTLAELCRNWGLPVGTLLIMAVGFTVGMAGSLLISKDRSGLRRAFRFQCTINNYVFLPLPLVMLYWGEKGVAMLLFSSIGSEIAVWTLGVLADGGISIRQMARRLLTMPMAAIAASIVTIVLRDRFGLVLAPDSVAGQSGSALLDALTILGAAAPPLAMVVAGSRMAELHPRHLLQPMQVVVAALRLVLIPALALLALQLLPLEGEALAVLRVVAVMPAAIASVMLSELYKADSEFAAAAVLLTHVAALGTIPLWLAALGY
jgi:predicted permease